MSMNVERINGCEFSLCRVASLEVDCHRLCDFVRFVIFSGSYRCGS